MYLPRPMPTFSSKPHMIFLSLGTPTVEHRATQSHMREIYVQCRRHGILEAPCSLQQGKSPFPVGFQTTRSAYAEMLRTLDCLDAVATKQFLVHWRIFLCDHHFNLISLPPYLTGLYFSSILDAISTYGHSNIQKDPTSVLLRLLQ